MRRWIWIVLILLVVGGVAYVVLQRQGLLTPPTETTTEAAATPDLAPVRTELDIVVDAVVVPVQHATLSMAAGGIVAEVLVKEGDQVAADELIGRLDNAAETLAVAQAEARVASLRARLEELRAGARAEEIAAAQAAVDAAQAGLDKLKEGASAAEIAAAEAAVSAAQAAYDQVREGPDTADRTAAEADIANAEASLKVALSAYDEVKWRPNPATLPQAVELEQAQNAFNTAQARYDDLIAGATASELAAAEAEVERAQAQLEQLKEPPSAADLAAAEAEVRRAQAELDLRQAGTRPEVLAAAEAELQEAELTLEQRKLDLAHTELRAPFAGTIAELTLKVGEQVAAGTPVVQLADLSTWLLETEDLNELNVVGVREAAPVTITVDALPDRTFTGQVQRIKPLGENTQGDITYTAVVSLNEQDAPLRWRMTAAATIAAAEGN
jgi:multidrug efflux pump subunit AcrA (membrane-fusion protein)